MNINSISKILLLCCTLFMVNGCTYHKAMNTQTDRGKRINTDLYEEKNRKIEIENERAALEAQLYSLNSELSKLDREIEEVKIKTEQATALNKKKSQQDYENQLATLQRKKASLENDIREKQKLIEVL